MTTSLKVRQSRFIAIKDHKAIYHDQSLSIIFDRGKDSFQVILTKALRL